MRRRLLDYTVGALAGLALAAFWIGTVPALIAAAVLILTAAALFAVRAMQAVQINRIFREEIDEPRTLEAELTDPDPFNTELRLDPAELLYDLTIGFHDGDEPSVYRLLSKHELASELAEHDTQLPENAIRGRHTRAETGLQLTWQPSTTDTGETR